MARTGGHLSTAVELHARVACGLRGVRANAWPFGMALPMQTIVRRSAPYDPANPK